MTPGPPRSLPEAVAALHRLWRRPRPLAPLPPLDRFGPGPPGAVLVGGAIRDALLGIEAPDLDWTVPDPRAAAATFADTTGGTAFPLDEERDHWRVVAHGRTHDLVPREGTIEEDLRRRDFTVNAMALTPAGLIDPLGGLADLRRGRLVAASGSALWDDPLRGLRGVRLTWTLPLFPDRATRGEIAAVAAAIEADELALPAAERRREELRRILYAARAGDALLDAHALGWLVLLLPELVAGDRVHQGGFHHLDVLRHQLEALQRLASGFPEAGDALRLATLLHDVGKPATKERGPDGRTRFYGHAETGAEMTRQALRRLRFEGETVRMAAELVRRHMLPLPASEREARRFVHRRRALLPDLLKLMIADREAARGRLSSEATRRAYRLGLARVVAIMEETPEPPPLLDGHQVMRLLELPPGPRVGRAVRFLREAQAVGDVNDEDEAGAALRRFARAQGWRGDADGGSR